MDKPSSVFHQVVSGLGALLAVALAARVAWELLKPLVPALLIIVALAAVFRVVLGRRRW